MIEKMGAGVREGGEKVEVITGRGCSRMFWDFTPSFRSIPSFSLEPASPASSISIVSNSPAQTMKSSGPFSGLVVCVTGLSKETRKQVKEATERLGGQYSPQLHSHCTHLVVQSLHGRKFEHALKHGPTHGLFLVTIGWFVDSVKRNVRLNEALYNVNKSGNNGVPNDDSKQLDQNSVSMNSCLPAALVKPTRPADMIGTPALHFQEGELKTKPMYSSFAGHLFYIDDGVPAELRLKVIEALSAEGASLVRRWYVGCNATYVVCERPSIQKYLGHSNNLVTPLWVLKSAKEHSIQRLVHLSADLARCTGALLDVLQHGAYTKEVNRVTRSDDLHSSPFGLTHEERQTKVSQAKDAVRKRRNFRMQTCQTPIYPITPGTLLDSICWSISESTSTATIYTESSNTDKNKTIEDQTLGFFDAKEDGKRPEISFVNLSRPLTESEKSEPIFKGHFLTILFPVDRFSEMGPCSRAYFSNTGFTCLQVLDHIYTFYQGNMSAEEIEVSIHTDSRHADLLRSAYSSKEAAESGHVKLKRIDFLGCRKSFEMLKRVPGDNNSNVYECLLRA